MQDALATMEEVNVNGVPIKLSAYALSTMVHCVHGQDGLGRRKLLIEYYHSEKMRQWLADGDATFLDVGAATGIMCVPFAKRYPTAQVIAFEPHRKVRADLLATLIANDCNNVLVLDQAISSAEGVLTFSEVAPDDTGKVPYKPETSALTEGLADVADQYPVRVTTLDAITSMLHISKNCVIKIDVEGWEVEVLAGARRLLAEHRPRLSIDIHQLPDGSGSALDGVKAALEPLAYHFEQRDHVLLCTP